MNKKRRCRKRHSVIDNTAITGDKNSLFRNEGMKRECALHPSRSLSETQPFTVACAHAVLAYTNITALEMNRQIRSGREKEIKREREGAKEEIKSRRVEVAGWD